MTNTFESLGRPVRDNDEYGNPITDDFSGRHWTGVDGNTYIVNIDYHLYTYEVPWIAQALSPKDPAESPIRDYVLASHKAVKPSLLDRVLQEPKAKFAYGPASVGGPYIHPHDVSTVISACYRLAEGRGIRNKLRSKGDKIAAGHMGDRLGEWAAREFMATPLDLMESPSK